MKTKARIEQEIADVLSRSSGLGDQAATVAPAKQRTPNTKIRVGMRGRIMNVDDNQAAALFEGAQAQVLQRLYFPDTIIVELLNDGSTWHRGQVGQLAIRYFIPDRAPRSSRSA